MRYPAHRHRARPGSGGHQRPTWRTRPTRGGGGGGPKVVTERVYEVDMRDLWAVLVRSHFCSTLATTTHPPTTAW
jgi:hypothetical protein